MTIPSDSTVRLQANRYAFGRADGLLIHLNTGSWFVKDDAEYTLVGTLTVTRPDEKADAWKGELKMSVTFSLKAAGGWSEEMGRLTTFRFMCDGNGGVCRFAPRSAWNSATATDGQNTWAVVSAVRNCSNRLCAFGPMATVRVFPRHAVLWCGERYTHTAPDVSRSHQRRAHASPGRHPVHRWNSTSPADVAVEVGEGDVHHRVLHRPDRCRLPVAVVNLWQVWEFAKATGQLAKTDRLVALLSRFG